tara:strand:- start:631 stop:798 length:168 start_codon:yes stop_codon:yes gene_type:complete
MGTLPSTDDNNKLLKVTQDMDRTFVRKNKTKRPFKRLIKYFFMSYFLINSLFKIK